jgi:hypothetical protein
MNSVVRVGDGDELYGEQWNLSGDRRVSIVLRDLNIYFIKLCQNMHPKTPLKCSISI